ncbi:MAG: ribonuclease Y [Kiritimatiellae bacterium]|nr:ribonuclease Y [Kiritimatiellia bacterium]
MFTTMAAVVAALIGLAAGYLIRNKLACRQALSAEKQAARLVEDAHREAAAIRREAEVQAKAEVLKAVEEFEKSTKAKRKELETLEERLNQRELNLERKVAMIDKKEHLLDEKLSGIEKQDAELKKQRAEVEKLIQQEREQLERIARMTQEEARNALLSRVEKEIRGEMGTLIRHLQEEARETAEREARKIVALAVQRFAAGHASEIMTSTVTLPSEDMKGRIIGRDGRNIRALESATGVNILIDDTPDAVVISGFDPVRREVAKLALESLIADGRIHPARIEEVVARIKDNMDETIRTAGESAATETGVQGVAPELIRALGRLKFRTSYSQNVLQHSLEVSHLMGVMAAELELDATLAKRIGLFHDIGKALDHAVEGSHALIGADLLKRHGEAALTVNAVAAHHEEVAAESLYALLAAAADAISSSRVGARSETTEIYLKRLEKLEQIARSFEGVSRSYAIQAGRELRVFVEPEKIDDAKAMVLAREITKKIANELQYPGQIRVLVIRETRCVEYAR